jgi:hypothetical protein
MGKESPLRNKPKEILPFELDTFVTVTVKSLVASFSQKKEVKRKKTKYIECFIVNLTTRRKNCLVLDAKCYLPQNHP